MFKKFILIYLFVFLFHQHTYAMSISGEAGCLISADTSEIVWEKNSRTKLPMASTTKIMTGLLACEYEDFSQIVTVSKNAQNQEGSSIYLKAGNQLTLEDLTYGLMLSSGNDSAVAIAEHIGGSVEKFCDLMNEKAKQIGAKNTSFKNPNGLNADGHYTTAYDLAKISAYAMKNDNFKRIVSTKSQSATLKNGDILYFKNHNRLLNMYDGVNGVKTGFTKASGRCLVSSCERDGVRLIAVTLNAPDDWNDHKRMFDYGFSQIGKKDIVSAKTPLKTYTENGESFDFSSECDLSFTTNSPDNFNVVLHMPKSLPAPINKGEKAGFGEVFYKDEKIAQFDILSNSSIPDPQKTYGAKANSHSTDRKNDTATKRSIGLTIDRTTDRTTDHTTDRTTDLTTDRATYLTTDRATNTATDRATNTATDRATDRTTDRATDRTTDHTTDRATDRAHSHITAPHTTFLACFLRVFDYVL